MILGIDIGTTNVKLVSLKSGKVVKRKTFNHDSEIENLPKNFKEQNPTKIISQIFENLENSKEVTGIAVCGQMHGILCWDEFLNPVTNSSGF